MPKGCQHLAGMPRAEEVNRGAIGSLKKPYFKLAHEPRYRHPEVIPYHQDTLQTSAVALPQRPSERRVFLSPVGVHPLLELVDEEDDLLTGGNPLAAPKRGERFHEVAVGQSRTLLS